MPTLMELGYDYSSEDYRVILLPAGVLDNVKASVIEVAKQGSESEAFRSVTEDNTKFPVVFIGQKEIVANACRSREATEEVMGDNAEDT